VIGGVDLISIISSHSNALHEIDWPRLQSSRLLRGRGPRLLSNRLTLRHRISGSNMSFTLVDGVLLTSPLGLAVECGGRSGGEELRLAPRLMGLGIGLGLSG